MTQLKNKKLYVIPITAIMVFVIGFFFAASHVSAAIADCLSVSNNLIKNCSFEIPGATPPPGYYPHSTGNYMFPAGYTGLTDWKVIAPVKASNIGYFMPGFPTPSGKEILDLSGFVDQFNLNMNGEQAGSGVEQTVTGLIPGQQYQLFFSQGYLTGFPSEIGVFVDGVSRGTFDVNATTPGAENVSTVLWKEQSITFTATSSTAAIRFISTLAQPGGKIVVFGSALDNVSLVPVRAQVVSINLAPTSYPDSIELEGVIRDFKGYDSVSKSGSPDFEKNPYDGSVILGLVNQALGADNKPVFKDARGTRENNTVPSVNSLTGKEYFDQWYNNISNINVPIIKSFNLTKSVSSTGAVTYSYNNSNFFPVDNEGFGNEGRNHNFHFTTEIHNNFTYVKGQYFTFSGDDDVWVFINKKLVVDIGGIHAKSSKSVNLDDLGLIPGNTYSLDIFHAERHTSQSNFGITTSIVLDPIKPTPIIITPTPIKTPVTEVIAPVVNPSPVVSPTVNTSGPVVDATIDSNNNNHFYAAKGNVITLNYTLSEIPVSQKVTIGDEVVDPVCIGEAPKVQCSAAIIVTRYMPLQDGLIHFSINLKTGRRVTATQTTDGSYVIVDRSGTPFPVISTAVTEFIGTALGNNGAESLNSGTANLFNSPTNTSSNNSNTISNTADSNSNNSSNAIIPANVLPLSVSSGNATEGSSSNSNMNLGPTSVWGTTYTANGPLACSIEFTRYLRKGDSNTEVSKIQKFLNRILGVAISDNGVFESSTDQAVKTFQQQYVDHIITPWKLSDPTGWWYQSTRSYANYLNGCSEGPVRLDNGTWILNGEIIPAK